MHVRKVTSGDLEPHRVGAGGEEECAIGVPAAIRQLYILVHYIDRGHASIVERYAIGIGEYAFGVLLDAGFEPADADRALNVVLVWTLGFVALEVPRMGEPELTKAELDKVYELLPADVFPHTATVKPNPIEIVSEPQFELGLRCLIESLRSLAP